MIEHPDARDQLFDLIVPSLGDPGRRAALKAHVATCPECQAQLEELRRLDARLRDAGPLPEPSAALDAGVRALPAYREAARRTLLGPSAPPPAVARDRGALAAWRAAAVALAAVAAVLAALLLRGDGDGGDGPWRTGRAVALEAAPGWPVRGTAALETGPAGRYAVRVAVDGLRPADGQWYELWLARSPSDRVSLGRFRPDGEGRLWTVVSVPTLPGEGYGGVWLTREPDDGDPGWTRDWVFKARLT